MLLEISVGYDPAEDRIHLQLRCCEGDTNVAHRLLLTRRLCLPFCAGLQDLVRRSAQVPETVAAPARQALQAGHHQARLQQTSMTSERRESVAADDSPPRLVLRALCGTRRSNGKCVVRFECQAGEPLVVTLGERTLHALAAGIDDRMRRAAWSDETAPALTRPTPGAVPPAGLH